MERSFGPLKTQKTQKTQKREIAKTQKGKNADKLLGLKMRFSMFDTVKWHNVT
jgi:hypothetical protein